MEPATQAVPGYFVWQVPGQPVVVHLSIDVVDRMGADIMRGFGLVPKRGAEVGGVLIGTVTPDNTRDSPGGDISTIRIDDFEPVPCTYARGPSYLLTGAERELFEEVCQRRGAEAVGYYRSHTRDGLALQPEDLHLLERHFQLALLVKPFATKPGVAGFFVRENGAFPAATPLEFPFRRWEMTGEEPPRRTPMQERKRKEREPEKTQAERTQEVGQAPPVSAIAPQPYYRIFSMEPAEPPKELPEPPGPKSRTGMWMVASFVFLLLGVLLGYEASRITAPQRGASDFAMSLAAERTGENLTVRWNPTARAVLSASNGVLEIDDGGETKHVELDRSNLSNGSVVYHNMSERVHFRLVVYLGSGLSVAEALEWAP
jgi:hypothetical protein